MRELLEVLKQEAAWAPLPESLKGDNANVEGRRKFDDQRRRVREQLQAKKDAADRRDSEQSIEHSCAVLQETVHTLEAAVEERSEQLEQVVTESARLENELAASRKEAAVGREPYSVQIDRETKPLKKTVKELRKREELLKTAQSKADRKRAALTEELKARTSELESETEARKKDELEFLNARRKLDEASVKEKNKLAEYLEKFNEGKEKGLEADKLLRRQVADLKSENIKLELLVDQRTRKLVQAADQRISLESRLAMSQEEAASDREMVQEQIDQKTQGLMQQLKNQLEKEEQLKAEQSVLNGTLTELNQTLDERADQLEGLRKVKQHLEDEVACVNEDLVQRAELFKEERSGSRKAGEVWQQRENELIESVQQLKRQMKQQVQDAEKTAGSRRKAEQKLVQLNKVVKANYRVVENFAEDLSDPLGSVLRNCDDILAGEGMSAAVHTQLVEVRRCASRLQDVLGYRLEISRLSDGAVRMQSEEFELSSFLAGLDTEFSEKAAVGKSYFAFSCARNLLGTVSADPQYTKRVLQELFDHALANATGGQMGLHVVSEELSDGRSQIIFQLMYSGLEREVEMMSSLLGRSGEGKSCRNMTAGEFHIDLIRRHAQLLGGGLYLEYGTERNSMLRFVMPVVRVSTGEAVEELPEACCA